MSSPGAASDGTIMDKKLTRNDSFCFECGPHVPCFTECCGKLQLCLTPYDTLRLRKRLGMTADEFMDRHTDLRLRTLHGFPELMMKMSENESKRCPFVTDSGCSVYEDRPGACRIYPLGRASKKHPMTGLSQEFYFTVREDLLNREKAMTLLPLNTSRCSLWPVSTLKNSAILFSRAPF